MDVTCVCIRVVWWGVTNCGTFTEHTSVVYIHTQSTSTHIRVETVVLHMFKIVLTGKEYEDEGRKGGERMGNSWLPLELSESQSLGAPSSSWSSWATSSWEIPRAPGHSIFSATDRPKDLHHHHYPIWESTAKHEQWVGVQFQALKYFGFEEEVTKSASPP